MHFSMSMGMPHQWSVRAVVGRLLGLAAGERRPRRCARRRSAAGSLPERARNSRRPVFSILTGRLPSRPRLPPAPPAEPPRPRGAVPRRAGSCALWHVVHASPPAWAAASICGNFAGRATLSWWQRTQRGFGSRLHRLACRGVLGVLRERAVAALATHMAVVAALEQLPDVGVALDAGAAAGVDERPCPIVLERAGTVVAVHAEALGHQQGLQGQEDENPRAEQGGHPDQVSLVAEGPRHRSPPDDAAEAVELAKGRIQMYPDESKGSKRVRCSRSTERCARGKGIMAGRIKRANQPVTFESSVPFP